MQQELSPRKLRLKHQQELQQQNLPPNQTNNNNKKNSEELSATEFVKQLTEILEQMSLLSQCNTLFDTFVEEKLGIFCIYVCFSQF